MSSICWRFSTTNSSGTFNFFSNLRNLLLNYLLNASIRMPRRHLRVLPQAGTLSLFFSTATPLVCAILPPVTWCRHLSPGIRIPCLPSPVLFSLWQSDRSECNPAGPIPLLIGLSLNKRQIHMMWEGPNYLRDGNIPSFLQDSTWKSPFLTVLSKVIPHLYPLSTFHSLWPLVHLIARRAYSICSIRTSIISVLFIIISPDLGQWPAYSKCSIVIE